MHVAGFSAATILVFADHVAARSDDVSRKKRCPRSAAATEAGLVGRLW